MKKILLLFIFIFNFENSYEDNKIAYIDIDYILNNSIAGQSISKHIQRTKEKKNNELKLIEKQLADKENDIIKKKKYNWKKRIWKKS